MNAATANSQLPTLPGVPTPYFIVFTDFDESFLAAEQTAETRADLRALRHWLEANATRHEILFGFVTGSNIGSVLEKLRHAPGAFLPHFVGAGLGSELHFVGGDGISPDSDFAMCSPWEFEHRLTHAMRLAGIEMTPQRASNQGSLKRSFYLMEYDAKALEKIRHAGESAGLSVNCNRCNPACGDPVGACDIDFIPRGAGKAAVARYLLDRYNVPRSRAWGFGDSGNDIQLLQSVGNPFCVANATEELRGAIEPQTTRSHAGGILEVLVRTFG